MFLPWVHLFLCFFIITDQDLSSFFALNLFGEKNSVDDSFESVGLHCSHQPIRSDIHPGFDSLSQPAFQTLDDVKSGE
jgi:hypothetical protein